MYFNLKNINDAFICAQRKWDNLLPEDFEYDEELIEAKKRLKEEERFEKYLESKYENIN